MFARISVKKLNEETLKKFNINNDGFNRVLPVIILLERDKEILRFPPYKEKGSQKIKYDKKILRYHKVIKKNHI